MKHRVPRFSGPAHSGRSLALQVLLDGRGSDLFVQEILDKHLSRAALSPADRRLATHLAYGVLRRRGTLDYLLRPVVSRPPHQVEAWLWDVLRLGAFQLALMVHIPPHAAIHETVELAAGFGRPGAKGFVNGVLRTFSALLTEEPALQPAADALPREQGHYRKLSRPVLPDPAAHPVEYVAAAFALPRWLVARWLGRYPWEECLRLGFWFARPAPLWLRCNLLRTDRAAGLAALAQAGIGAEAGDHPQSIRLEEPVPIRDLPGYEEGWFAVQDESAMRAASALAPAPGGTVLDLCAAPGGKATLLAELMHNQGRIFACDVDDRRLRTLTDLCQRLGVTIVETCRLHPERNEEPPAGPFDTILVDVPCSNTGVLGRRPEDFRQLVPLQTKLLLQAAERIKPGGAIVYSTCSIEPEENEHVVQVVVRALPELELEAEELRLPGRPADGSYWARLRRQARSGQTLGPASSPAERGSLMASQTSSFTIPDLVPSPLHTARLPILYEDDEEGDLGESNPHVVNDEILHICLRFHLAGRPEYQVFSNMNLYYQDPESPDISPTPYVSPDTMVVAPFHHLGEDVSSYQIGKDGPAPLLTVEILSERSAQQRDLDAKVILYAKLGIAEYILVDVTGRFLPQKLLLKRLQPDQTWKDEQDPDGGVTSKLGFRLILDTDGRLRVLDATTGKRYARPDEAQAEAEGRRQAEARIRELEAELARLQGTQAEREAP